MTIEEAIKNLEKEVKCRNEDVSEQMCLKQECREGEGGCPYFVKYDAVTESLQVVVEWFENEFAKK